MPTQLRTGTAAVNSVRDKMPMFVIEKAQNRVLLEVSTLPISTSNGVLFEEWVPEFDRKFSSERRSHTRHTTS